MNKNLIYLIMLSCVFIYFKKADKKSSLLIKHTHGRNLNKTHKNVINKKNINNIPNLFQTLSKYDNKFKPKISYSSDGRVQYKYFKINPNNLDLDAQEIESRIKNFNFLFSKEKQEIIKLIDKLNEIGVLIILGDIQNMQGISGYWKPKNQTIVIDNSIIKAGTYIFHDVLSHEAIHVAQSCASGSVSSNPTRIGLPLNFSNRMNRHLSHQFYIKNSQEGLYIEQEAYSHSKEIGTAYNLLNQLCS